MLLIIYLLQVRQTENRIPSAILFRFLPVIVFIVFPSDQSVARTDWNRPELSIRGAGQEDRSSGNENGRSEHSGQMSAHVRGLSTSGLFPEHTTERTVREFVNEILLGIFFWWMNHYLNDLPRMIPRMTEDLCGSKRKKGIQFE